MRDVLIGPDGQPEYELQHNEVSRARLSRMIARQPCIEKWPIFLTLAEISPPIINNRELSAEESYGIYTMLEFLKSHPEAPDDIFDKVANSLLSRIGNGGIQKLSMSQVVDALYESSIGLALSKKAGPYWRMQLDTNNLPDHEFVYRTCSGEHRVAIECKNIREYTEIDLLIVQVVSALRKADDQHAKRSSGYHDFVIFVDLPPSLFAQSMEPFYTLVVNVFAALRSEGRTALDESRILFTATSESNLNRLIKCGYPYIGSTVFVRPHIAYKSGIEVSIGVGLLWSCLWSTKGANISPKNWANVALEISSPDQYLLERFKAES